MSNLQTGWTMALSFIFAMTLVIIISCGVYNGCFSPLTRVFESRQRHRHEMAKMKLRAELVKKGMDPEYVAFMQKEMER